MNELLNILKAAPAIVTAIQAVEGVAPQGPGAAKADAVLQLVSAAAPELATGGPLLPKAISVLFTLAQASNLLQTAAPAQP